MNMRIWPFSRRSKESYTRQRIAMEYAAASRLAPNASQLAVIEAAAGFAGRAFRMAETSGEAATLLDPGMLEMIARELVRNGELVLDLADNPPLPATNCIVSGMADPASWSYTVHLAAPSGTETITRSSDGVLHFKVNVDPRRPWRGRPSWKIAGATCLTASNAERQASERSAIHVNSVLPVPPTRFDSRAAEADDARSVAAMADRMNKTSGTLVLLPAATPVTAGAVSGSRSYVASSTSPPHDQAGNELRRDANRDMLACVGLSENVFHAATDSASREALKKSVTTFLAPLGNVISEEIRRKTGMTISFKFETLMTSELTLKGRTLKQLIESGVTLDEAMNIVGLTDTMDDTGSAT